MLRNRKGFTLIELLIVVVIIGILAAIAIPKFSATKDKAKLASLKSDIGNIRTAQEAYFSDGHGFASTIDDLKSLLTMPAAGSTVSWVISGATSSSYTATATDGSITSGSPDECKVTIGTTADDDGMIICS